MLTHKVTSTILEVGIIGMQALMLQIYMLLSTLADVQGTQISLNMVPKHPYTHNQCLDIKTQATPLTKDNYQII
jgi:hypothetical protein